MRGGMNREFKVMPILSKKNCDTRKHVKASRKQKESLRILKQRMSVKHKIQYYVTKLPFSSQ